MRVLHIRGRHTEVDVQKGLWPALGTFGGDRLLVAAAAPDDGHKGDVALKDLTALKSTVSDGSKSVQRSAHAGNMAQARAGRRRAGGVGVAHLAPGAAP